MLPISSLGIGIFVREGDVAEAVNIIRDTEANMSQLSNGDFKDANLEDIEYEREVRAKEQMISQARPGKSIVLVIVFIVLIYVILYTIHLKLN